MIGRDAHHRNKLRPADDKKLVTRSELLEVVYVIYADLREEMASTVGSLRSDHSPAERGGQASHCDGDGPASRGAESGAGSWLGTAPAGPSSSSPRAPAGPQEDAVLSRIEALERRVDELLSGSAEQEARAGSAARGGEAQASSSVRATTQSDDSVCANMTAVGKGNRLTDAVASQTSVATDSEKFTVPWEVPLEGTVWDALLLVGVVVEEKGSGLLSKTQAAVVVVLGIFNILIQLTCIWAIMFMGRENNPLDENVLSALMNQRLTEYHDVGGMDRSLLQSKARRLCSEGVYNQMGVLSSDVDAFLLPEGPIFGWTAGALVGAIALFVWTMSMTAEVQRIYLLQTSVMQLKGPPTSESFGQLEHALLNDSGDGFDIVRLSLWHKVAFTVLVQLPRLVISLLLLVYGLLWLSHTVSVDALILNACALEMVYNIDEALFKSVLVNIVRVDHCKIASRRHMYSSQPHRWRSELLHFVAPVAFLLGFVGFARLVFVDTFAENARTAQHHMCGEDLDFVFAFHGVTGMPYFSTLVEASREGNLTEEAEETQRTSQQFRCVFAASRDLIALRAGFPAIYLDAGDDSIMQLLNGQHSTCIENEDRCATRSLSELYRVNTIDDWELDHKFCFDQDLHMAALTQVCTHKDFFDPSFSPVFEYRRSCMEFQELCRRREFTYEFDYRDCAEDVVSASNLSAEWTVLIRQLCPETCLMCHV